MKRAMEEVHRDVAYAHVGAVWIELEPRPTEMIDERSKAAAASHGPVEQQIVGGAEDPFVTEQLVPDALQRRVRYLAADQVNRADGVTQTTLNAAISHIDWLNWLGECLVDADRSVEVAQDPLEVLGLTEQRQIFVCQPAIACLIEQGSISEGWPDVDTETVAAEQRGA